MANISAVDFARALHTKFDETRAAGHKTNTSGDWTHHVFPLLGAIAKDHRLWWAGRGMGKVNPRYGERREYLWDFTMYEPDSAGLWNLPRVIIEHENAHGYKAFSFDHWKTLCGYAPLRVAIGYRGKRSANLRYEWIEKINLAAMAPANEWLFPPDTEDLIALGYDGMTASGNFEFWRRRGKEREWSPLQFAFE